MRMGTHIPICAHVLSCSIDKLRSAASPISLVPYYITLSHAYCQFTPTAPPVTPSSSLPLPTPSIYTPTVRPPTNLTTASSSKAARAPPPPHHPGRHNRTVSQHHSTMAIIDMRILRNGLCYTNHMNRCHNIKLNLIWLQSVQNLMRVDGKQKYVDLSYLNATEPFLIGTTPVQPSEVHCCVVCLSNLVQFIIIPCGHAALCSSCAQQINECPICRGSASIMNRVYFPS